MQVCSLFLKIIKKNIGFIIMYLCIFSAITAFTFLSMGTEEGYIEGKVNAYIEVEEENSSTYELLSYLDILVERVELKKADQVDDALFWNDIDAYIKIPKDFYNRLLQGEKEILTIKTSPDSLNSYSLVSNINTYFNQVKENIRLKLCLEEEALSYTKGVILAHNSVEVKLQGSSSNLLSSVFNMGIYIICALTLLLIGVISFEIRTTDISRRLNISPVSSSKRNIILAFCYCGISVILVGIISLIGILLFPNQIFPKLGYFVLNMSLFAVTMVFMALFISSLFKSSIAFNCVAVIFPLAAAFICGSFVDLSFMPVYTQALGHALPNIYIAKANIYINTCSTFSFIEYLQIVWPCFLFIIGFLLGNILISWRMAKTEN